MKRLSELYNIEDDRWIKGIKINSKEVLPGDIFVCTMGVNADRHDFIDDAIEHGASAIVVSKEVGQKSVPVIKVANTNDELRELAAKFYDYPYKKVQMIGVTGTNGKTTVAEIIYQLLGNHCAYIGTNGKKYDGKQESIRNTTPDVDRLYKYFAEFIESGCKTICMEASSEAFFRHRLDQIRYDIAVLTNITQDHLNIHKTLENYINCKCQLFRQVKQDGYAILNSGDTYFEKVKAIAQGKVVTYGFLETDNLYIKDYQEEATQTILTIVYQQTTYKVISPLLGSFNVVNVAAAMLAALCYGMSMAEVIEKVAHLTQIEGRMEIMPFVKDYMVMLDYAHTPDALSKILTYLNKIKQHRIITVTGSAGGREKEKRPTMGKVVLEKSDYVIFTMDDPRDEPVEQIINDLVSGCTNTNYERIIDRKTAIHKALSIAQPHDIILIAGKGRDNYMAIGDKYLPYCDYDVIKAYYTNQQS